MAAFETHRLSCTPTPPRPAMNLFRTLRWSFSSAEEPPLGGRFRRAPEPRTWVSTQAALRVQVSCLVPKVKFRLGRMSTGSWFPVVDVETISVEGFASMRSIDFSDLQRRPGLRAPPGTAQPSVNEAAATRRRPAVSFESLSWRGPGPLCLPDPDEGRGPGSPRYFEYFPR